ncbi:L-serine ammonia-lyase [Anaeromyxobacter paludicola]|nr:L-serine ammonia-lyase [Anaeromyxobacter paludicola]
MRVGVFDLFKIGIGPSSSHTVGPMRAARLFAAGLRDAGLFPRVAAVQVTLHGSLGATGRGHGTDRAVVLGLLGESPEEVDVAAVPARLAEVAERRSLSLLGERPIPFRAAEDLAFDRRPLPFHPNAMRFTALDAAGAVLQSRVWYSVGGGFVVGEGDAEAGQGAGPAVPYPFHSGEELVRRCVEQRLPVSGLMRANERALRPDGEIEAGLQRLWAVMQACVRRGFEADGVLPGGLRVPRRAPLLYRKLRDRPEQAEQDPLAALDWVTLWALAVNEENAAGGRVVTAPTNGAAGIVPAVMHYYRHFVRGATDADLSRFLLTAAAIGALYKENASISGAEVGCQGEVGSACSMAAGALCELLGGTPAQVENAAEIAMEHHLGLTCDPIGGLVQIPCIERNAAAAVQAIHAARLALQGDGHHFVSLDQVIRTMRDTGADMKAKYKETSRGGLAVTVEAPELSVGIPEC